MSRRGFKIRKVVSEFDAPSKYSVARGEPHIFHYEILECGHVKEKREIESSAEAVRMLFHKFSGEPVRRRCFECVSGDKSIPEPAYIPSKGD